MYSYHVHSTFSDGKNTPEEIILASIDRGFISIGFSDHGYTDFDLRYCMKDQAGYVAEINRLKEKYKHKIQIYLGSEEDAFQPVNRKYFDYIIGSCHYGFRNNHHYPVDSSYDYFKKCLAAFDNDHLAFAESYYYYFCQYINTMKPDIIGHFDLITKFDEVHEPLFLENKEYTKISEKYTKEAIKSGSIFEINTGAMARGFRTSPYPYENLLYILQKHDAAIILSSDSHKIDTLDFAFEETKKHLKSIGFRKTKMLYDNKFIDCDL